MPAFGNARLSDNVIDRYLPVSVIEKKLQRYLENFFPGAHLKSLPAD
jgi:hypothetical protein